MDIREVIDSADTVKAPAEPVLHIADYSTAKSIHVTTRTKCYVGNFVYWAN
jgi:hypothetical protein